jgi:hypothetical protein
MPRQHSNHPDAVCSHARRLAKASAQGSLRASPEAVRQQHRADASTLVCVDIAQHTQNIERHRNVLLEYIYIYCGLGAKLALEECRVPRGKKSSGCYA